MRRRAWPASRPRSSSNGTPSSRRRCTERRPEARQHVHGAGVVQARADQQACPRRAARAYRRRRARRPRRPARADWSPPAAGRRSAPRHEHARSAARSAADRPAAPEPTTIRSKLISISVSHEASGRAARLCRKRAVESQRSSRVRVPATGPTKRYSSPGRPTLPARRALADRHQRLAGEQRRKGFLEVAGVQPLQRRVEDRRVHRAQLGQGELVAAAAGRRPTSSAAWPGRG